jgi:hypothetical protein
MSSASKVNLTSLRTFCFWFLRVYKLGFLSYHFFLILKVIMCSINGCSMVGKLIFLWKLWVNLMKMQQQPPLKCDIVSVKC